MNECLLPFKNKTTNKPKEEIKSPNLTTQSLTTEVLLKMGDN